MSTSTAASPSEQTAAPLLTARKASSLCGLGLSTWWRYLSAGKIPAPVRIGGSVRWRRDELFRWLDAGCPPREKWEAMATGRLLKK